MRLLHLLLIVAMNAIPLAGVVYFGWSTGTLLVIFWAETLVVGTANVVRIVLHRRWTGKRGHYRPQLTHSSKRSPSVPSAHAAPAAPAVTLLSEYTSVVYIFSAGHGIFLGILLAILSHRWTGEGENPWMVDFSTLAWVVLGITVFAFAELALDIPDLPRKPFRWIREHARVLLGRVVVLHLGIIFGAFTLAELDRPLAFLGVLIVLKALLEIGASAPKRPPPDSPPRWLVRIAAAKGLDAQEEWTKANDEARRLEEEDEQTTESA